MTEADTARDRLERLLYLIPAAAVDGGIRLEQLASELAVPVATILGDLEEITGRAFYQRPGEAEQLRVTLEGDRVSVWTPHDFRRPRRLAPREALSLCLALRALAVGAGDPPGEGTGAALDRRRRELARRLEAALASAPVEELAERFAIDPGEGGSEPADALFEAARLRRACRIRYLKPRAPEPEDRVVEPYVLACGEGSWYVVGRCRSVDDIRIFRFDRVLAATALEGEGATFRVPEEFDSGEYLRDGRVYLAEEEFGARVRYSPRIARWLLERGLGTRDADGSVVVEHGVADPGWLVRHVLQYGPDAEVLSPPWLRDRVAEAVRELSG